MVCNFFFDANLYGSIFSKNAIKNPALAEIYLASWRDMSGIVHHDLLHEAKTNNQGEYGSMLMVLRHIRNYLEKQLNHQTEPEWLKDVVVYGDSQLVIYQLTGKYKVKEEELKPLWLEAINLVHVLKSQFGVNVTFQWIRRDLNNEALNIKSKISDHDPDIEKNP